MEQALNEEQCVKMKSFLSFLVWAKDRVGNAFKAGKTIDAWNKIVFGRGRSGVADGAAGAFARTNRENYLKRVETYKAFFTANPQATAEEFHLATGLHRTTCHKIMRRYGWGKKNERNKGRSKTPTQ
jgi:hypothetical protein